jgi:homocysteine S-methyltransferase
MEMRHDPPRPAHSQRRFIYDDVARTRLAEIHAEYMRLAREARLPLLTTTDTWRCSQRAIQASRFNERAVNQDNARFLIELRDSFGPGSPIYVGGLVGPSGDAYKPEEHLKRNEARDFHTPQIVALASSGVDYLQLATAPNVEEALGVADAMAATDLPYIISFVIRRTGTVLDGTSLGEAIARVDTLPSRPPIGVSINCVHGNVLDAALGNISTTYPDALDRIVLFQANAADAEVEELDNCAELISEPADMFAAHITELRNRYTLRVVGGCCGTDSRHIEVLAGRIAQSLK